MSNSKMIAAILSGAAAGAVVGLLFAPQSGVETRKKLASLRNQGSEYLDQLVEEGKKTWYETKGMVETNTGIAASELDDFVRHILQNGRRWWSNTRNRASEMADEAEAIVDKQVTNGKKRHYAS